MSIRDQVTRTLGSLVIEKNDEAARSKVKTVLESVLMGSTVSVSPINPEKPRWLTGSVSHPDLNKPVRFRMEVPPAELCLVCGEALEHVRVYGCVAGIRECPYEASKLK